jgi:hypothetical protein
VKQSEHLIVEPGGEHILDELMRQLPPAAVREENLFVFRKGDGTGGPGRQVDDLFHV